MRYGALTELITIETYSTTTDSAGGRVKSWSTYAQPYAHIKYTSSSERLEGERDTSVEVATFAVQYDSDTKGTTTSMRISYNGYWDIESVRTLNRYGKIEIRAVRRDS